MNTAVKSCSVSRLYAPVRICADMAFYFYVIAILSFSVTYHSAEDGTVTGVVSNITSPWALQIAVLIAACLALGFITVRIESAAVRFVLSLLPGLSFLMSPFRPVILLHAAAFAYYMICMTIGSFEEYLDVYRKRERIMLIGAMILTCFYIVFRFANDAWYANRLLGGEEYGLMFFVLSVAALRGMRLSSGAPGRLRAMDTAFVIALPALVTASVFLFSGAVPFITLFFKQVMVFLSWLIRTIFPGFEMPDVMDVPGEQGGDIKEDPLIILDKDEPNTATAPVDGQDPQLQLTERASFWVLIVVIAAALVLIAVKLIRRKQPERIRTVRVRERIEKVPFEEIRFQRSAGPVLPPNVRQLRRVYRDYLEHIRSLSLKLFPSDTSEDVLQRSSERMDVPENAGLRNLYIAARYGDPKAVTSGQVAEAARCLSVIKAANTERSSGS